MTTSAAESPPTVGARAATWRGDVLTIELTDARSVAVDVSRVAWLGWLRAADARMRRRVEIEEPGGFALYWPELDDGIEIAHLLGPAPVG
jgi:hypothetical protein